MCDRSTTHPRLAASRLCGRGTSFGRPSVSDWIGTTKSAAHRPRARGSRYLRQYAIERCSIHARRPHTGPFYVSCSSVVRKCELHLEAPYRRTPSHIVSSEVKPNHALGARAILPLCAHNEPPPFSPNWIAREYTTIISNSSTHVSRSSPALCTDLRGSTPIP